jgi:hypothetical protein
MSEALAIPAELPNPLTGELIRTSDLQAVGATIEALRSHKRKVDEAIAAFSAVVVEESHRQGSRTLNVGATVLEVSPEWTTDWDITELAKLLAVGLPDERYNQLVKTEVNFKVDGRVARQLAGASPKYAAIIEAAKVRTPARQRVSVK